MINIFNLYIFNIIISQYFGLIMQWCNNYLHRLVHFFNQIIQIHAGNRLFAANTKKTTIQLLYN